MGVNYQASNASDEELIVGISNANKNTLEILYTRYVDRMLGLACRILNNKSDAEDVIHDVFIEVWQKAKSYQPQKSSVLAWLMLRVRSRSLDRIRRLKTVRKHAENKSVSDKNEFDNTVVDVLESVCQYDMLEKSLNVLSTKQRIVIELNYFKGLSCAEISNIHEIPLGTVKTRLLSAMKLMRQYNLSREVK